MPAGIYDISGGTYTFITHCSLNMVLKDREINAVTPLHPCTGAISVDHQGWPIPPSASVPAQKWHLSEGDLLKIAESVTGLSPLVPTTHRWVTNLTPRRPTVFLAEIKEVWGYRYLGWTATGCWTPIMVKFKVLWLDTPLTSPVFPMPTKIGRSFFEFFYISRKGRLVTATRYSQAALFPDALEYFVGEMRKSLLRPPDECGEGKDIYP